MFTRNPWKLRNAGDGDYRTRNGLLCVHRDTVTGTACVYLHDVHGDVPVSAPFSTAVPQAVIQAAVVQAVTDSPVGKTLFRVNL